MKKAPIIEYPWGSQALPALVLKVPRGAWITPIALEIKKATLKDWLSYG